MTYYKWNFYIVEAPTASNSALKKLTLFNRSKWTHCRKKFKQNKEAPSQFVPIPISKQEEKIADLTKECELLENAMERAKNERIKEVDEHERTGKEKDEIGRQLTSRKKLNENLRQRVSPVIFDQRSMGPQ